MAGAAMPMGAALASIESIGPEWLETELRHTVVAFGGGALLAAIALVLVPEGVRTLSLGWVAAAFALGGLTFMSLDIFLASKATPASQLVAMLTDFIPEALALGATFAVSRDTGLLLAGIIALQNLPEGFNAHRELTVNARLRPSRVVAAFALLAALGPVAGLAGYYLLADHEQMLGGIMLFAAGGILYLIFQDIAPQAHLKRHWAPPLGALAGFLLGVMGKGLLEGA